MLKIRKSNERGQTKTDWLISYHTFSFADYQDKNYIQFGPLRVINEDYVKANQGFGMHPHQNMEIITYLIAGELSHKDSMGNGSIIHPGEIQRMTAGTGVLHSEFNHAAADAHLLQIWIHPQEKGLPPSYEQETINKVPDKFILIASDQKSAGVVKIHQDVALYAGYFTSESQHAYHFKEGRGGWLQLVKGKLVVNGIELAAGDGLAIADESELKIKSVATAECLLFDLSTV